MVAEAEAPPSGPAPPGSVPLVPPPPPEIVGAVCFLTSWAKERGKKRVEGKLAKRFGYIMVAFTLCWLPLVAVLLLDALWHQDHQVRLKSDLACCCFLSSEHWSPIM